MDLAELDKEYILGKDIFSEDNILDPITFDDLILAVYCNYGERTDEEAVIRTFREILTLRLEDAWCLLDRNLSEIEKRAKGETND